MKFKLLVLVQFLIELLNRTQFGSCPPFEIFGDFVTPRERAQTTWCGAQAAPMKKGAAGENPRRLEGDFPARSAGIGRLI